MKDISCNLCGSNNYILIELHKNDEYFHQKVEVRTVVCKNCGLVYRNPQPTKEELSAFYSYRKFLPTREFLSSSDMINKEKEKWVDLYTKIRRGRILDVGCSIGNFLNLYKSKGWEAYGIEPAIEYAKFGREKYGLNIQTKLVEDVKFPNSFFDVITVFQVLEHLKDPAKAMFQFKKWLKPSGLIFISVPNVLKPDRIKLIKYFAGPHLFLFSPNTLSLLLKKTGFEVVDLEEITNYVRIVGKREEEENV
jgi:2-polyprenyl-3-methyl-5-hydroxy-6-metoxy-1,4-benzoquinol methylase